MQCHYAGEAKLFDDATFLSWVLELECVMVKHEREHGFMPYDVPLAKSTGLTCWYQSYADGMTPQQALDEDISNWQY